MIKKYPITKTLLGLIKTTWHFDKKIFFYFIIYTIVASIYPLFAIFIPKLIIGELMLPAPSVDYLLKIIGAFVVATAFFGFLESYTSSTCRPRLTLVRIEYLTNIFHKANQLDYHYMEDPQFLNKHEGAFQSIGSSNQGLEEVLNQMFRLLAPLFTILFYIVLLSRLSGWVLLGLVASVGIGFTFSVLVKKFRYRLKEQFAQASRKIRYYSEMTHDFSFGKDIRLYQYEEKIRKNYQLEIASYVGVFKKVKNKEFRLALIELIFVLISDAVLYYILITKVLNGLSIADFSMYLLASVALSTLLKTTAENVSIILGEGQYIHDYNLFMNEEFNIPNQGINRIEEDALEIEFRNVSFRYPGTEKWIIRNLNLTISKKEKLAIVGINGAGKTTIVKLITRLFEPTEGEIWVNGQNATSYRLDEYHKMFATLFQDINILAFTVRDNITLQHDINDERVWACLKSVGLDEKVKKMPQGLDTMMLKVVDENGALFSGGENQKLAIARALYKKSNAVILDEPTAALDALAEAEIYQNFNELVENKTAIYISHRLASTKFCDKIALFQDATLLEYGNHEQLMALQKEYYHMFVVQGKYYQENPNETMA
ncbi:MAG: ABC transporter ATP-binding protein [Bacilli bacterium]|nr:ABC transporter ATP-binding protein [Bacilli bacterium]